MALFCSGPARTLLSSSCCTSNTILVSFASLNILGVYFEPSLSKNKVQRLLLSCTKADLVLGDVNIQYGAHWGGVLTGPCPCLEIMSQYCATFNLAHICPSGFLPCNDHVYACAQLVVEYLAEPAIVSTDHYALSVVISSAATSDVAPMFGLELYHLYCLDNPIISTLLCGAFDAIFLLLLESLTLAAHKVSCLDVSGDQALVEELDAQVLAALSECCSTALGTYMVPKMKITPVCYLSCLQACTCPADAVTLFKHLCKTVTSSVLLSCNPGIDATEDAALYFEGVFAQSDVTLCGVSLSAQQCHGCPCPEIVEFFSASNVC
ncbi:hypothetical protein DSO57_1006518 [Entomophthora muscae]|uniref:Uncharacterized protein n=1 Tax=Entomophthora muscae TaxID=34485 RepID=A0ACC2S9P5_9FUNG|nr:hypothetical protein DSO57_1006518 [Entomophthora muscae]